MADEEDEEQESSLLSTPSAGQKVAKPTKGAGRRRPDPKHKAKGWVLMLQKAGVPYNNGYRSENDFGEKDPHRWLRFLLLEFITTYCYVVVSAGSVLSTGALTFQWDINEQSPGRILCISFAQGFIYCALLYSSLSFLDNKFREEMETIKSHDKFPEYRDWPVGYFNPALTLACAITKTRNNFEKKLVTQISWMVTFIYSVVQLIAGVLMG